MVHASRRGAAALIVVPIILVACAVFVTARIQRQTALHAGQQQGAGQRLLTGMLDQETGARGFFETRQPRFLTPWYQGQVDFASAMRSSRALSAGDASLQDALNDQQQQSSRWRAVVGEQIRRLITTGRRPSLAAAMATKQMMDEFRGLNLVYASELAERRDRALSEAAWLAAAVGAGLALVLMLAAGLLLRRGWRKEAARLGHQHELRELLQVSDSEEESQDLLIRHVLRSVPGSDAIILQRNNSDDRLEVSQATGGPGRLQDLPLEGRHPRSCLAIRMSRSHSTRGDREPLLVCEVCGRVPGERLCEPLLVGGRVIGSVLLARPQRLNEDQLTVVQESVSLAAPILANQRNLALAERRAASDALTGLPNRRASDEAIKRMVAQAGRTISPVSAVLIDLDRFKQVNDLHGHERGDQALSAVGQILSVGVRASDFAARYGGEEFLLLLPDTDRQGARELAEKLRLAIEHADLREVGGLTASFGVATLPDDAADAETLMRKADRALYAAKARGRNRVEAAHPVSDAVTPPRPGLEPPDAELEPPPESD